MSEPEIKVGDVVVLKSGGPKMTVAGVRDLASDGLWLEMQWFDGATLMANNFPLSSVEAWKPAPIAVPSASGHIIYPSGTIPLETGR